MTRRKEQSISFAQLSRLIDCANSRNRALSAPDGNLLLTRVTFSSTHMRAHVSSSVVQSNFLISVCAHLNVQARQCDTPGTKIWYTPNLHTDGYNWRPCYNPARQNINLRVEVRSETNSASASHKNTQASD